MNTMSVSRESTQAFVQYRVWTGSGYISVFNAIPLKKKKKQTTSTLAFRVRSKKNIKLMLLSLKVFQNSLLTQKPWSTGFPAVHMGSRLVFAHMPFLLWCWPSSIDKDSSLGGEIIADGWECLKHQQCIQCSPSLYTKEDQTLSTEPFLACVDLSTGSFTMPGKDTGATYAKDWSERESGQGYISIGLTHS